MSTIEEVAHTEDEQEPNIIEVSATLIGDENEDDDDDNQENEDRPAHQSAIMLSPERPGGEAELENSSDELTNPIEEENWRRRRKHVFILSSAGKPVFSRYGDESDFSELFGILQVLMSMAQSSGTNETLRRVTAGPEFVIHFHTVGELSYVMVSRTEESTKSCVRQLRLLHLQMLSVLPTVNAVLTKSPGYDVRRMFSNVDAAAMRQLIKRMSCDPTFIFRAASVVAMGLELRRDVERALVESRNHEVNPEDHLYSLALHDSALVASISPKDQPLHIDDFLLLINFVAIVCSNQQGEIWAPICLPKFNDTGYLWCYCTKFEPCGLTLVQLATAQDAFPALSRRATVVQQALQSKSLELQAVFKKSVGLNWTALSSWDPPSTLQWFAACTDAKQMVSTRLPLPLANSKQLKKFTLRLFARLRDKLGILSRASHPVIIHSTEEQSYVIVKLKTFEGFGLFLPCTPRKQMVDTVVRALKTTAAKESTVLLIKAVNWA